MNRYRRPSGACAGVKRVTDGVSYGQIWEVFVFIAERFRMYKIEEDLDREKYTLLIPAMLDDHFPLL